MSIGIGLTACAVSSLFFGSMFVPIKNYNSRDGLFAQWMMSIAILLVGFAVFIETGLPGFYPLAMLGGASWCIGNVTAIPIISRLGLAISVLIWNTTNCLIGWAGGRFGLFGMKAQVPASPLLNYIGLICVVTGGVLFSQVKADTSTTKRKASRTSFRMEEVAATEKMALNTEETDDTETEVVRATKDLNSGKQRTIAIVTALIAGLFYGMTFVPVIYMTDNPDKYPGQPADGISYVFSHYFGIFLTSTTMFVIYSIFRKNQPYVAPELCLPGLAAGFLWAVAQTSFFIANQHLSQTVTFPIVSQMPGCIAAAWSIFYYKEIRGRRNFTILACAMTITVTGATLVGLSKSIVL